MNCSHKKQFKSSSLKNKFQVENFEKHIIMLQILLIFYVEIPLLSLLWWTVTPIYV